MPFILQTVPSSPIEWQQWRQSPWMNHVMRTIEVRMGLAPGRISISNNIKQIRSNCINSGILKIQLIVNIFNTKGVKLDKYF